MSINTANFPASVWNGTSPSRSGSRANVDRGPDKEDWDQIVAEIIAMQAGLQPGVDDPNLAGVAAGTLVSATSKVGQVVQTTITLAGLVLTTTDSTTAFATQKIFDFPVGNINILGAVGSLAIVAGAGGITDTAAVVMSVGTVAATQGADLTSTEANIIPSTAFTLTAGAKTATRMASTAQFIGETPDAILNLSIPDAGTASGDTVTVTGTITISWINLG